MTRHLALALLFAALPLRAQDDGGEEPATETRTQDGGDGRINTIGQRSLGGKNGGGSNAPGQSGTATAGGLTFHIFPNLAAVPEHQAAHAILRFPVNSGYSVGFLSGPEGFASNPSVVTSPAAVGQGCAGSMWVSEKPAGKAVKGASEAIVLNPSWSASITCVATSKAPDKKSGVACALKPNTRYYFNVVVNMPAEQWMANVPDSQGIFGFRRKTCDTLVGSPLGYPENLK